MTDHQPDCIFCKIVRGEIPATVVYRDDRATAFRDIAPAAPTHILVVPNRHLVSVADMAEADAALVGHLAFVAGHLARQAGIDASGYRLIVNHGSDAGQTVHHLHLHLLGGRNLGAMVSR